ncbi:DUF551 domain-containing protein [Klebsiella michiganensis]|nr:DUF551 domain-containing protein [Klebsiella michiganensis]QWA92753.1 DUF551 domain-containing protein [Klebsiella michiganensis]HDX8758151.1 DUF551 domain-containing protein [Klebsiella michiganensis]
MTHNQLTENSITQLLNNVRLARDNAERDDNRVDHSFYYALTRALEELQERRKAERDSEPVAYMYDGEDGREYNGHNEFSGGGKGIPLYRHAQQPLVPPEQHWEELCRQHPEMSIGDAIIRAAWWNHCRAAMLQCAENTESRCGIQTAPALDSFKKKADARCGNSPVIPGWIPISERMPENDVSVLTFDGMYKRVHHAMYGHWQCWEPEKITHWMPLPAAPQEEPDGK